jgi:FkbM family methyltransferase
MKSVPTRYGLMDIIEHDLIVSKALLLYGEWAQAELDLLELFISPGACVLDAGAFIGTHTLAFAKMVGAKGKIYAFEPRREIFEYLERNIALNGAEQVHACNVALGALPAELALNRLDLARSDNFGGLSLTLPHETATETQYRVPVVTLDGMNLPPVNLIKLDVEGMESEVLAGADALITRDRPIIFAECNSLHGGAPLLTFAQANRYRVFGSVNGAYHPVNFNKVAENIFGAAKELSLVLLPGESVETYREVLERTKLPEVENLDSLACLLLSKPQYFDEALAVFCGAHDVKLALESPEQLEAYAATGRCEAALSEVKILAFARLDEIKTLTARVDETDAALNEAQQLAWNRLKEIEDLQAALAAERDHAQECIVQLEKREGQLQALEQTKTMRALRRVGLMKVQE